MLETPTIQEFDAGRPGLHAFRISGRITGEDMEAMAEHMNAAFDAPGKVDMLLSFRTFEGAEAGAGLNWESLKSRFRAVTQVRNYVTAGAPDEAEDMIGFFGSILPVQTKSFDTEAEAVAWLQAQPPLDHAA